MPALGFAMGDVVLGELMNETSHAREKLETAIAQGRKIDIYVVIAKEQRRADALAQIQQFRDRGYRVDYPLTSEKVGKQFQTAEQLGARIAVLFGDEWPQVKVKNLASREESLVHHRGVTCAVASVIQLVILSAVETESPRIARREILASLGMTDGKHVSHARLQFTS